MFSNYYSKESHIQIKGKNITKCGSVDGYIMQVFSGKGAWHYTLDGSQSDNTDAWDAVDIKELKTVRCSQCDTKLGIREEKIT
jgi:hypothetical protein